MEKITQKNLLKLINDYFTSIGLESFATSTFNNQTFSDGIVLKLPDVCLIPQNKPFTSRSKQTHIHITGENRLFFYDRNTVIASQNASTPDIKRYANVSMANISHLKNHNNNSFTSAETRRTYTMTKIGARANQDSQVQISKIREDGSEFIEMRKGLFTSDLLIFLKYRNVAANNAEFFVVGIPKDFYENNYEVDAALINHLGKSTVRAKAAIRVVEENVADEDVISDSEEIADNIYQQMVDLVDDDDDYDESPDYSPEAYTDNGQGHNTTSNRPKTSAKLGKDAIKRNRYKCIFSTDTDEHTTFIKQNGKPYMEVHHLIPVKYQSQFINKLDTPANLVPVCPLCHRKLHHGRRSDVNVLLSFLYTKRSDILAASGLNITETELQNLY